MFDKHREHKFFSSFHKNMFSDFIKNPYENLDIFHVTLPFPLHSKAEGRKMFTLFIVRMSRLSGRQIKISVIFLIPSEKKIIFSFFLKHHFLVSYNDIFVLQLAMIFMNGMLKNVKKNRVMSLVELKRERKNEQITTFSLFCT